MTSPVFAFGKNWQFFLENHFTAETLDEAKLSLTRFTELSDFRDRSFIDIGCGSGLFSLAAFELGAESILSLDVDLHSVECCRFLWNLRGQPTHWKVVEGSILDSSLTATLGQFDIVYSWGVLHHTGKMWDAVATAASLVKPRGLFYIALYNKADGLALYPDGRIGSSAFWKMEKKLYTRLPGFLQNTIDYAAMIMMVIAYLLTFNNPVTKIRTHGRSRGMSWRIDIKDWLGGYPYEYARADEVFSFVKSRGFQLQNLRCNNGLFNNEFLFSRNSA